MTVLISVVLLTASCGDRIPEGKGGAGIDYLATGKAFTRFLTGREYDMAYAMTSGEYRAETSLPMMREAFEAMVPQDWGETEPVEASLVAEKWPAMKSGDLAMVYISIYGDVYSEAVTVVVGMEEGQPVIR